MSQSGAGGLEDSWRAAGLSLHWNPEGTGLNKGCSNTIDKLATGTASRQVARALFFYVLLCGLPLEGTAQIQGRSSHFK